jgi:hypothetical protein
MIGLLDPVKAFIAPHQGVREPWWDPLLTILQHYSQCLEQLTELESTPDGPVLRHVAACSDVRVISALLDFAEHGDLPSGHDFGLDDEEAGEETSGSQAKAGLSDPPAQSPAQKVMGKAKASVLSFVTSLCWEVPYDPATPLWSRMRSWLARGTDDRDDLMNTALMCFANGVRSG